jgi:hypothetical protein
MFPPPAADAGGAAVAASVAEGAGVAGAGVSAALGDGDEPLLHAAMKAGIAVSPATPTTPFVSISRRLMGPLSSDGLGRAF